MSIREALARITAPKQQHKSVRVNSRAEAASVKRERGIITAVRDLSARVAALAGYVDKIEAKAPEFASAATRKAVRAATDRTGAMFAEASRLMLDFNHHKGRLERERGRAYGIACQARDAADDDADKLLEIDNEAAHIKWKAAYSKYWGSDPDKREVYDSFHVRVDARKESELASARQRYEDRRAASHAACDAECNAAALECAQEIEAREFLLWMQLRALANGEPIPTIDDCPGIATVDEDGAIPDPDSEGERLWAEWEAERKAAAKSDSEFG